jgi:diguanylate cyclase (GGDEF)-like protein
MLAAAYHAWTLGAMSLGDWEALFGLLCIQDILLEGRLEINKCFGPLREMSMPEKILVMDTRDEIRCCLSEVLSGEGYAVITTDNIIDGLRYYQVEAPDLIIADISLPIGDCLDKLHDSNKLDLVVDLIVLAGKGDLAAAVDWVGKGAYDFVSKPVAPRGLIAAVRRALQKRHLALENQRLVKELAQVTIRDPLTGVYNHRHMYNCLMDEIVRATRYNRRFLLMISDIDRFRSLNETYGRYTGDLVLTRLARLFEENLRLADGIFRYEGGKFLFLLPETRICEAVRVAERILEGVRYHPFDCNGCSPRVTVSMGAAEFPMEARDIPSLIRLADQRLAGAKQAGGDGCQFESLGCASAATENH